MKEQIERLYAEKRARVNLINEIEERMNSGAGDENRAEDLAKVKECVADVSRIDDEIATLKAADEMKRSQEEVTEYRARVTQTSDENRASEAVREWLRSGSFSGADRNTLVTARTMDEARALSISTANLGGYTIDDYMDDTLYQHIVMGNTIMNLPGLRVINRADGRPGDYPIMDGTGADASKKAPSSDSNEYDPAFGNITITPGFYRFYTDVENELLADSHYNVESELTEVQGEAIGRGFGKDVLYEDTLGILDGSRLDSIASTKRIASSAAGVLSGMTYQSVNALSFEIAPVHRQNASWLVNTAFIEQAAGIQSTTGQPVWRPSMREGEPNRILGYPYVENTFFKGTGTSNAWQDDDVVAVFGDFRSLIIVRAGGVWMLRDPFTRGRQAQTRFHMGYRLGYGYRGAKGADKRHLVKVTVDVT